MGLEESHLRVSERICYQKDGKWEFPFKWHIRDKEVEALLEGASLTYKNTVKPNCWTKNGHRFDFTLISKDKKHNHNFGMEIMIGNCGAVVWHGIGNMYDNDTVRMVDFIVKNVASMTGTATIIATGYKHDTDKLVNLCGWPKGIENKSSRDSAQMGYLIYPIPEKQMAKYGYNYKL